MLSDLNERGFTNVVIQGTRNAKYGEEISLVVTGEYKYSMMTNLFSREDFTGSFKYDRVTISRKVIN